jgi:hypothetical protein
MIQHRLGDFEAHSEALQPCRQSSAQVVQPPARNTGCGVELGLCFRPSAKRRSALAGEDKRQVRSSRRAIPRRSFPQLPQRVGDARWRAAFAMSWRQWGALPAIPWAAARVERFARVQRIASLPSVPSVNKREQIHGAATASALELVGHAGRVPFLKVPTLTGQDSRFRLGMASVAPTRSRTVASSSCIGETGFLGPEINRSKSHSGQRGYPRRPKPSPKSPPIAGFFVVSGKSRG